MVSRFVLLACAALVLTSCGTQSSQVKNDVELPISRVVMYQSGIGYVERYAEVKGDELVLRIRPDQVNDILKSLTVIDRGKGRPVSISLPVDQTTLDRIAQIPDQVKNGSLHDLLEALRGANVKIKAAGGSHTGRIVGLDRGAEVSPELNITTSAQEDMSKLTLFTDDDVLEVIAVKDIRAIELFDKALSEGLTKSLNVSLNDGNWKQLELRIRMDSAAKRELAMSYLIAMPTWNPAYRLILGDNDEGILQGWAIISNVTGSDWNDISFSLVSGQPMSFTYDLYTPHFLDRPDLTAQQQQNRAIAPEIVRSSYAAKEAGVAAPMMQASRSYGSANMAAAQSAAKAVPSAARKASTGKKAKESAKMLDYDDVMADMAFDAAEEEAYESEYESIRADEMMNSFDSGATEVGAVGSYDEYKLASALTVPDGSTALVNLVQSKLSARDTRLFKVNGIHQFDDFYKGWKSTTSFQTVELKNGGDVALDSGPITIYRDSAIIGEGFLSRTEKSATAYITFATESNVAVRVADVTNDSKYRLESFKNGRCQYSRENMVTTKFSFESHIGMPTTAILPMPLMSSWEPVNFPDSVTKTATNYMVSASLPANETIELPLTMKLDRSFTTRAEYNDENCTSAIKQAVADDVFSADQKTAFTQYLNDQERLQTLDLRNRQLNEQLNDLKNDQRSLTETLAGLKDIKTNSANSLKNQLMERQKENDKQLEKVTMEIYTLHVERSEIELRLKSMSRTMEYVRK